MIVGLILAAGKSERMGKLKTLLPFDGETVLGTAYKLLKSSSLDAVRVVLGHRAEEVKQLVEKARQRAKSHYTHEVIVKRLEQIYETCMVCN